MAQGALGKYQSDCAAILDLLRFGPGICKPFELLALLFHVERSLGKDSDQHSQNQAVHGIVSKDGRRLIRGPAGMCLSLWKRANAALAKYGFVVRTRRKSKAGKDDPSEYVVVWSAISAAIENYQEATLLVLASGHHVTPPVATTEPLSGHHVATPVATTEPLDKDRIRVATTEPHISPSQSLDFRQSQSARAEAILFAVAKATDQDVRSDGLKMEILELTKGVPEKLPIRFIHEFCHERNAIGKSTNPGLVAKALRDGELKTWLRKAENRTLIEKAYRAEEQEAELAEAKRIYESQKGKDQKGQSEERHQQKSAEKEG